jgi:hypothetical protein
MVVSAEVNIRAKKKGKIIGGRELYNEKIYNLYSLLDKEEVTDGERSTHGRVEN